MRIRDRLTWTLSVTALIAVTLLGSIIYIFTATFHELEFFSRLEERVSITEIMFLENDAELESTVRDRFLQTLDEEEEYAISFQPSGVDSLEKLFPPGFASEIQNKKRVQFWQGDRQGVGVHYYLPRGEYAVVVTALDKFGLRKLDFLRKVLLLGGFCLVGILVLIDRLALSQALKPLENTSQKASSITADRLDLRLHVKNPNDEIGKVANAFNKMLDRLQNAFEAQRLFVRNASHEIKNPLTAISGEAEVLLQKKRSPEEYQQALQTVLSESTRLQVLISQLLDLEKTDALFDLPNPEIFPLDQVLLESIEHFPSPRFKLEFDPGDEDSLVYGSKYLLQTALINVLDNALKYSGNKAVTVAFSNQDDKLTIIIADEGQGIPEEDVDKIFQAFFRSSNARTKQGHGIGLALVKKIIDLHNGEIQYNSVEGKGTAVVINLPQYP
ncbi:MAG: HAMP domain-containing sensor histidine kinase [Bacteroidota bacterium]